MALHFIGFRDDQARIAYAARIFGEPDFIHWYYDVRAKSEIAPTDTAVFASDFDRERTDTPREYAYNDSDCQLEDYDDVSETEKLLSSGRCIEA